MDPVLSCMARGFHELCPACRRGDLSLCERMTSGHISPGLLIGACRDTGEAGACIWSPTTVRSSKCPPKSVIGMRLWPIRLLLLYMR